ncbi:hypothetical protein NQZ79_g6501 [Umbelopsis isabellina]|nr:hypothetical protein NQZ79_g6501 [Umbelopsis isabellina]
MDEQQTFSHPDLHPNPSSVNQSFPEPKDTKPSSEATVPDMSTTKEPALSTAVPSQPTLGTNGSAGATGYSEKMELPPVVPNTEPSLSSQIQKDLQPAEPPVSFEQDPTQYVQARFWNLVMWHNPPKTAIYLIGSLLGLIITQHYSLLQIFAAIATLAIGINWVFVNAHVQGQKLFASNTAEINNATANPHRNRLQNPSQPLSRTRVTRLSNTLVDAAEVIANEGAKIVLIDDNKRSLKYLCGFYVLWTVAKYLPSRWIVGLSLGLVFTLPKLYYRHQDLVDARVNQATVLLNEKAQMARDLAQKHANDAYQQISTRVSGAANTPKKTQ